jgi:flagellar assembly protein FliH
MIWTQLTEPAVLLKYTEQELQERLAAREKAARKQTEATLSAEYEAALGGERGRINDIVEQFGGERKTYFERVEVEVVQLALEIARKILHREAEIDPLFLTGVVRAALEKLDSRSAVRLRVPEDEADKWHQIVKALEGTGLRPEVTVDASLGKGCVLETEVGTTNISLDHQLLEVERSLLDLLSTPRAV